MVNANGKLTSGFSYFSSKTKDMGASQRVQKFCTKLKGSNKTSFFVVVIRRGSLSSVFPEWLV